MFYSQIAELLRTNVKLPAFHGTTALTKRELHSKLHELTGQHFSDHQITEACKHNVKQGYWARHVMKHDYRFEGYTRAKSKLFLLQEENDKLRGEVSELRRMLQVSKPK